MNHETGDGERIFSPVYADVWDKHLKGLSGAAVKVYIAILMHTTQQDRTWYMSIDEIAEDAGISRSAASDGKNKLIEIGLIEQWWRYKNEKGDYHLTDTRPPPRLQGKNVYKVHVAPPTVSEEVPKEDKPKKRRVRKTTPIESENQTLVESENQTLVESENRNPTRTPTPEPTTTEHPTPAGASDAIASGLPQSDQQSDSDQQAEVATGDDQGKGRHKDFQAFLDAYKSITDLDNQMIGEAARVWHSMFDNGSLPGQETLLEGLRAYWRACKHNERVTGRSVRKRPGNWLRDCMWAADEENLKFQDAGSVSAARFVSDDQMLASWGVATSDPQQELGSRDVVDGEIVEERAQINA